MHVWVRGCVRVCMHVSIAAWQPVGKSSECMCVTGGQTGEAEGVSVSYGQ